MSPDILALVEAADAAERSGDWDAALAHLEQASRGLSGSSRAAEAAEVARRIGRLRRERGELSLALESLQVGVALADASGSVLQRARCLNSLAAAEQFRGELERAEALYGLARELADEAGDAGLAAMIEQNLAILSTIRGDLVGALARFHAAADRLRQAGDAPALLAALNNMAMAFVDAGEWEAAERCFGEAAAAAARAGDAVLGARVEINRAELHLKRDEHDLVRECCERSMSTFLRVGSERYAAEASKFAGMRYQALRQPDLAETHFDRTVRFAEGQPDPLLEAEGQTEWALTDLDAGRYEAALRRLNRAQQLFLRLHARHDLATLQPRYARASKAWGVDSVERRDRFRVGQIERTGTLAVRLAEAIGVGGLDLSWLRVAAYLRDVGTLDLPAELLLLPQPLSAAQREQIRRHPELGHARVVELGFPAEICAVVRHHHERWDGRGYPDGLAAESIPLFARVVAVADVFDALTSARPYRPALGTAEALDLMAAEAGRLLDPVLFARFRALLEADALPLPSSPTP